MANDMDLKMRILARGAQAERALKSVQNHVARISRTTTRMAAGARVAFRMFGRAAKLAVAPLKIMAGIGLGLTLTLGALSGKALGAAGDIETLKLRLDGVSSSAKESNRIFAQTMRMSVFSPFEPDQLIDARIGLMNIGLVGKRALRALGDAASITQRPLADLVSVMAALEAEPLRRIGIEAKREAGNFEFTFRNKMQQVKKITAQGIGEAREALISIFEVKYGGGMTRFARAWAGLISTLRGNIKLGLGQFGEGLMPVAKRFVDDINGRLSELIDSGRLRELGEQVAGKIEEAFTFARAVFEHGRAVMDSLVNQDAGAWADAMAKVMTSGAEILATSLVGYLKSMGGVFVGLAKIMSAAFIEDILQLPFMGWTRFKMADTALGKMNNKEKNELFTRLGTNPEEFYQRKLTLEQEVAIAVQGRGSLFTRGIEDALAGITTGSTAIAEQAATIMAEALAGIQKAAGYQGPGFDQRLAGLRAGGMDKKLERILAGFEVVTMEGEVDNTGKRYRQRKLARSGTAAVGDNYGRWNVTGVETPGADLAGAVLGELTKYQAGGGKGVASSINELIALLQQRESARVVAERGAETRGPDITIHQVNIRADNIQQMKNEILRTSGMPALAPAGT